MRQPSIRRSADLPELRPPYQGKDVGRIGRRLQVLDSPVSSRCHIRLCATRLRVILAACADHFPFTADINNDYRFCLFHSTLPSARVRGIFRSVFKEQEQRARQRTGWPEMSRNRRHLVSGPTEITR